MREEPSTSVSVIIPTWNRAHSIVVAVESALAQTLPPLEVLVCDDGSTDATRATVEAIADERVRFIACPRSGRPAVVRNLGIAASRGDWLAFLDSDDAWLPGKLSAQMCLMHELRCLASATNARRFVPGRGAQGDLLDFALPRLTFAHLARANLVVCSSALIRRPLLERVGGFPEQADVVAAEDYALWLKVATLTDFAFVTTAEVVYTDDPSTSIRGVDQEREQRRARAVFDDFLRWAPTLSQSALALRWELVRRALDAYKARRAQSTHVIPP